MIFLNAERFLDEAIRSVLAQTYDRWELLFVDDGSTDGSAAIATAHAAREPERIRYLHHPGKENRGMSASRNLGIRHARGEFIALLDADDVYLPEKLERQVEIARRVPEAGMIYGSTRYWFSWTGLPGDEGRDRVRQHRLPTDTLIHPPELFTRFLSGRARTPCTCGVLMRRDMVEAIGGFEERFRGIDEDQVFFCKVALNAAVYMDSGCWELYRQHPDSSVRQAQRAGDWKPGRRAAPARARFVEFLEGYLRGKGVRDPEIWREVRRIERPLNHPRLYRFLATMDDLVARITSRARSRFGKWRRHDLPV